MNKDGTKWSNRSYEKTEEKEKKEGRLNFKSIFFKLRLPPSHNLSSHFLFFRSYSCFCGFSEPKWFSISYMSSSESLVSRASISSTNSRVKPAGIVIS